MGRIGLIGSHSLKNENETKAFGAWVAKEIKAPAILALYGDLGAGKTTFVQGLAEALGIIEPVQSPTFILLNLYEKLAHFDIYRLKDGDDFVNLGFCEYFEAPLIAAIEWPEKIKDLLPKNTIHIHFEYAEEGRIARVL